MRASKAATVITTEYNGEYTPISLPSFVASLAVWRAATAQEKQSWFVAFERYHRCEPFHHLWNMSYKACVPVLNHESYLSEALAIANQSEWARMVWDGRWLNHPCGLSIEHSQLEHPTHFGCLGQFCHISRPITKGKTNEATLP